LILAWMPCFLGHLPGLSTNRPGKRGLEQV
jgi:hypothetical protein